MCRAFQISSSVYYYWVGQKESSFDRRNNDLLNSIQRIYESSKRRYGSPRIAQVLKDEGIPASRPRVARLMRRAGIRSITRKKFRITTDSSHDYSLAENLLQRDFSANRLGEKWVSDLTYIRTGEGWLYLTTIMDLADRKIIGWALSETMKAADTTIASWQMAIKNRPLIQTVLFHSDRGIQYACHEFREKLKLYPVIQSMSRKGNCWDNAVAESFFKTIKTELIYQTRWETREKARQAIFEYIEVWYNRKRKHSTLGYLTPVQMEDLFNQERVAA